LAPRLGLPGIVGHVGYPHHVDVVARVSRPFQALYLLIC
jgi:hypothetical protein